jgi:hypothetical protein
VRQAGHQSAQALVGDAGRCGEGGDPGRGWDAVVVGEYERAFYGTQYALMAPLFEHYEVRLWLPEVGGRVDFASEHDEHAMTVLGMPVGASRCASLAFGAERRT